MQNKQDINYRLPDQCCGTCIHSYNNTYGDACCEHLASIDLIDFGGICDLYSATQSYSIVDNDVCDITIDPADDQVKNCITCAHSYESNGIAWCAIDNTKIEDVEYECGAYDNGIS